MKSKANVVVIQLFIAAGLVIGNEKSLGEENCDDVLTASDVVPHTSLIYLHIVEISSLLPFFRLQLIMCMILELRT